MHTYKAFMAFLDTKFKDPNAHLSVFIFRTAAQQEYESLSDYVTRLKKLAKVAGVADNQLEVEILRVITSHVWTTKS